MDDIGLRWVVPVDQMRGEDDEETADLRQMLQSARTYVTSHRWCPPIAAEFFGFGVGGVLAAFLIELEQPIENDRYLWVIEGDLPSAYFVTDDIRCPREALETYCELMLDWVDAVRNDAGFDGVFPVHAAPTLENARSLDTRLSFIRTELIPLAQSHVE